MKKLAWKLGLIFVASLLIIFIWYNIMWQKTSETDNNTEQTTEVRSQTDGTQPPNSSTEEVKVAKDKQIFAVETIFYKELTNTYNIEKNGKILPNQQLEIKSEVNGRINAISVKEWDSITEWQVLVSLSDTYGKYASDLNSAKIKVDKSKINLESQTISLNKQIEDSKLNLEKIEKNYEITKSSLEEDLNKAKLDLENSKFENENSSTYLDVEKIEKNIEKLKFDLETTIISNEETISAYMQNLEKEYNNLDFSLFDIIEFSDNLLWVTEENKHNNNGFEDLLGAKNTSEVKEAEIILLDIINQSKNNLDIENLTEENMLEYTENLKYIYKDLSDLLQLMERILNNSIVSIEFTKNEINWYENEINSFQSQVQNNYNSAISLGTSISSFIKTYLNSLESQKKTIAIQEQDLAIKVKALENNIKYEDIAYNKLLLSTKDTLNNLENQLASAKLNYENTIKNKEVSIKSLQNDISDVQNNYNNAWKEYNKLTIKSPISGVISNINIDKWEDVNSNTNLLSIISNDSTEIEVTLSFEEVWNVAVGDQVSVNYNNTAYDAKIFSKSILADENLNYSVKIILWEKVFLVWNIVKIDFHFQTDKIMVPIDLVEIESNNVWILKTYENNKLGEFTIKLGKIIWNKVEMLWSLSENTEINDNMKIITTDMWNYDPKKYNIVEKK